MAPTARCPLQFGQHIKSWTSVRCGQNFGEDNLARDQTFLEEFETLGGNLLRAGKLLDDCGADDGAVGQIGDANVTKVQVRQHLFRVLDVSAEIGVLCQKQKSRTDVPVVALQRMAQVACQQEVPVRHLIDLVLQGFRMGPDAEKRHRDECHESKGGKKNDT